MTPKEQQKAAEQFANDWAGKGYEKGQSQTFWLMLLSKVFGMQDPDKFITFEDKVHIDHTAFIDGLISTTHVLVEQKSLGKDLRAPIKQSDGSMLTPFQQAKRYSAELPYNERPRWIVTCNFSDFLVYDMNQPNSEPEHIELKNLGKEYYRLKFLVDTGNEHIRREMEVSMQAGDIIGCIYDKLLEQYHDKTSAETLHSLNMLCVRLVFCLYAEDAGIFGHKQMFGDYLRHKPAAQVRRALLLLFQVLDQKPENRDPYLEDELAKFPYVNGGLFSEEDTTIPQFTEEIKQLLCRNASDDFDWSEISPTIFGAIFESTLNPDTRRSGGMHYTSIENIHKVIDPLFLNDLRDEYHRIAEIKQQKNRDERLIAFQRKLGQLTFLDPACGSGNFLTESFISLRRLENDCLRLRFGESGVLDVFDDAIQVHIHQFYGIEINDFATTVAKTALWIAESQMMTETADILHRNLEYLPLKSYSNIVADNALRREWSRFPKQSQHITDIYAQSTEIVEIGMRISEPDTQYNHIRLHTNTIHFGGTPPEELVEVHFDYIMGNPPFVGARYMTPEQKNDLISVFGKKWKNVGNLDFVCAWYKKAADLITNTTTKCAFVSTNSICQGESVANLWKPLLQQGMHIHFAYQTFRWDSEAKQKAHVHCVIVGFGMHEMEQTILFDNSGHAKRVSRINGYLVEADDIFVESRTKPLCNVPEIGIGNKPIDGGFYLFTEEEKQAFIKLEPQSAKYFRPFYGAQEFINRRARYCLWLGDCSPSEIRAMPHCLERVKAVRAYRLNSPSAGTVKLADRPTRFHVENMPFQNYIVIPETSSENRRYIPMGFLSPDNFSSNALRLIPGATLYHFGVLTSNVHNAWVRAVGGRLKSDYRYSKDIVYNNFPWPIATEEQQTKIAQTAQAILDIRERYPDSSLADLYDETVMPADLRQAHQANDKAVMQAYGFTGRGFTEQDCVTSLFAMYRELTR